MPPHASLRIKIPIEREDTPPEKKTPYSYVPAYIHDLHIGKRVYTYVEKIYMDFEISKIPYSFTKGPGNSTTFMFRCTEEPLQMIGMFTAGSNYVKIYEDMLGIFVPLFNRVYQ